MFSYQHRYHAGGFSDVHKHICLIAILQALHKKPTPFAVMDAYAGEGVYDLSTKEARVLSSCQRQGANEEIDVNRQLTIS